MARIGYTRARALPMAARFPESSAMKLIVTLASIRSQCLSPARILFFPTHRWSMLIRISQATRIPRFIKRQAAHGCSVPEQSIGDGDSRGRVLLVLAYSR